MTGQLIFDGLAAHSQPAIAGAFGIRVAQAASLSEARAEAGAALRGEPGGG